MCITWKKIAITTATNHIYRVDHKKHPKFSAFEKTHVVSLAEIASAITQSTVCIILTYHINYVTQHVTEKYLMKKAPS